MAIRKTFNSLELTGLTFAVLVAVFILVLLVCCGLTHCFIEAPMQRLGRRVARRLDARFGPDSVAVRADGIAGQADGVARQAPGVLRA